MNWMKTLGLLIHLICLLFLPLSVHSLDTACAHVTDKNTTVTVTQIRYNHKFYTRIALASKYEYQSSLEDASTSLYRTTANDVKDEIESRFETTRVTLPPFTPWWSSSSVACVPVVLDIKPPADDITLLAEYHHQVRADDEVGCITWRPPLLLAAMLSRHVQALYIITTT
eukprot:XP_011661526.1 PREDICTED: uncharacterized protein LOC105437049 [Strongylocentrotus purpuratus]